MRVGSLHEISYNSYSAKLAGARPQDLSAKLAGNCWQMAHVKLHCLKIGKESTPDETAPVAVLLAGLSLSWFVWQDVALELAKTHTVIIYDRIGTGLSGANPLPCANLYTEINVLLQVLRIHNVTKVHLVAHSMASFIAQAACRLYPENFSHLTILDGSYEPDVNFDNSYICDLDKSVQAKTVVSKLVELLSKCKVATRAYAQLRYAFAGKCLSTLKVDDERVASIEVYAERGNVLGAFKELRAYNLWASQLRSIAENTELLVPVTIVAVYKKKTFLHTRWVQYLHRQCEQLKRQNPHTQINFYTLQGCHDIMRYRPVEIARMIARN